MNQGSAIHIDSHGGAMEGGQEAGPPNKADMRATDPRNAMLDSHNCVPTRRRVVRGPLPLILSILVLVYRECSAFVPAPTPKRPSCHFWVYAGLHVRTKRPAPAKVGASHLFASAVSGGSTVLHSPYAQKFLAELEASGRVLTKRDQNWWARFEELEEYKQEHGDCNVPHMYKANPHLGQWVSRQRKRYQQKKLSTEQIEALEGIGFEWARPTGARTNNANWWKQFRKLEEYKQEHGDCNVPQHYKANLKLGGWVNNQRQFYKNNKLESERIEALEDIGFEWTRPTGARPDDANWWKQCRKLEEYKQEHGDCNVPQHYKANPQLGSWVKSQRQFYKNNKLESERTEALEGIGFEWVRPKGRLSGSFIRTTNLRRSESRP